MAGISDILNIGRQALLVQQQAVDVTGHNIANVNTEGFSRQRVSLQSNTPVSTNSGDIGTGVTYADIQRVSDRFVGSQINSEVQTQGRWQAQQDALEKVETLFDESSGYGLNTALSEFWNGWQDLANNPSGQTEREILAANAQILASTFQKLDADLQNVQEDLDETIDGNLGVVNQLAGQISELNDLINQSEASGFTANDYRDERDVLLQELSELINFTSYETDDGRVTVTLGDGKALVGSGAAGELTTVTNTGTGLQDIVWRSDPATAINDSITGGKLGGWIEVRDTVIPDYIGELDTLAAGIITAVNTQHVQGYDINNQIGVDFFTGSSAGDIALNQSIADDTNLIAAAGTLGGAPGDNSNALAMAELQNQLTLNGATSTFDDYYNALVSQVGIDVKTATHTAAYEESLVAQLENYRESVSGVSLDEEMINLVKFQNAYDAAAKLIATTDEMMSTVLSMIS